MRYLYASLAAAVLAASSAVASDVELKGPHICCPQCVTAVSKILGAVDGVSNAKADSKTKTVTFTAADDKAAKAGVKALFDGGFFGKAFADGKELKVDAPAAKGDKTGKVTLKGVHACCGACHSAIKKIFEDSKVSITGTGPQRTIVIEGAGLEPSAVLSALRGKGFNGKVAN
ncbi:MAG: cation transporter [Planctomycetes bacterium]|nr:cation transporter [Planctomycetota bacterium]